MEKENVVYIYIYTHTHNGTLFSHKKNKIMPFAATWVDLETIILSEVSQKEKDKYHMISLICGILKNDTNELIYKTEKNSHRKQTYSYNPKGIARRGRRHKL